jgi:hypothetical protein
MDIAHYSMRLKVKHISLTSNNAVLGFLYVVLGCPGCLLIEANKMIKTPPTFTGWWGIQHFIIDSKL